MTHPTPTEATTAPTQPERLRQRLADQDWSAIEDGLTERGGAETGLLLDADACAALRAAWDTGAFRAHVDMARHGFGRGAYRYFDSPLPDVVATLRAGAYACLAPIANRLAARLGDRADWPETLDAALARCHAAGQTSPTPLLLRYGPGDYNCLHRDLYGEIAFPLQLVVQLSRPGEDFAGGQFVLVEQRPRMQSRAAIFDPPQGHGVVFATSRKPRRGARGWTASSLRHGVSDVTRGTRMTLGLIFHDAA